MPVYIKISYIYIYIYIYICMSYSSNIVPAQVDGGAA